MIKALIENYETLSVVGVFTIAIAWYFWHQTKTQTEREKKHDEQQLKREEKHDKQQDEYRKFHRDIITNHLKGLHDTSLKNSELNSRSMVLQEDMIKHMEEHNGYCREASKKIIESFSAVIDKLNGKVQTKDDKKNGQKKQPHR